MNSYPRRHWESRWKGVPGSWRTVVRDGIEIVLFCCPKCKVIADLSGHDINETGHATPSMDCPTDGCDFHEHIRLGAWGRKTNSKEDFPYPPETEL